MTSIFHRPGQRRSSMNHSPPSQVNESSRPAAATTLREGLLCISCGYDFRGSPPGGRCPECGATSLAKNPRTLARFGGEAWLRNAARGVRLWALAITAFLPLTLVFAAQLGGIPGDMESNAWWVLLGLVIIGCDLSTVVAAYGYWAMSAFHPVIDRAERRINVRRIMRLAFALVLLGTLANPIHCLPVLWSPLGGVLSGVCALSFGSGIPIGVLGLTWRVASLCRLAGADRPAQTVRLAGLAFAVMWVVGAASLISMNLFNRLPPGGAGVLAVATLLLGLSTLYTPCYLISHLRAALEEMAGVKNTGPLASSPGSPDGDLPPSVQ